MQQCSICLDDLDGAGPWANTRLFPGREFDDLDAYRAAKKQRKERRAAHTGQVRAWRPGH